MKSVRRAAVGVAAPLVALLTGCSSDAALGALSADPSASAAPVVLETVTRGDVVSVVTLDGYIVASPPFRIAAPAAGEIRIQAKPGTSTKGEPKRIGTVRASDGSSTPLDLPPHSTLLAVHPSGVDVPLDLPVAVARYDGFAAQTSIEPNNLYRFYGGLGQVLVQVERGPGPLPCPVLGGLDAFAGADLPSVVEPPTTPSPSVPQPGAAETGAVEAPGAPAVPAAGAVSGTVGPADTGSTVSTAPLPLGQPALLTCAPPRDVRLLVGARTTVAVTTAEARGVLRLPLTAVAGTAESGVVLTADGRRLPVELGISDGVQVEVRTGLAEGDQVRVPAPDLAPQQG